MALDLLFLYISIMLSDFSSSMHARRVSQNKCVPKDSDAVDQD